MIQELYLDTAATTRVKDCVAGAMIPMLQKNYGNPSSLHALGLKAEEAVKDSRRAVAHSIGAQEHQILFTGSGTEANNLALMGVYSPHILSTTAEHASIRETVHTLRKQGRQVTLLSVDEEGYIDKERFRAVLKEKDLRLISIIGVNNETGTVQDIPALAAMIKERAPSCLFHVDGIQAWGKIPFHVDEWQVDLLSLSAHKAGGPKGIGALYCRNPKRLEPLLWGGGQEFGCRSGTENTPGIVGMGAAARALPARDILKNMLDQKMYLARRLEEEHEALINGPHPEQGVPHILNVSFPGIKAQVLVQALSQAGLYVSEGSACSSHKEKASPVLKALGLQGKRLEGAIRISLPEHCNREMMDWVLQVLGPIKNRLQKVMRG